MEIKIVKAVTADREEMIDFANYVFSHAHRSLDFPSMLPKLYKSEYFMDSVHYLVKEDCKIKAAVGAYPLEWEFASGIKLPGRGIGMVSVHPYSRSKGYMRDLMNRAMSDMREDGIVFSCLGGNRQRYEYFGFSPLGSNYSFDIEDENIKHTLGKDWKTDLSLSEVKAENKDLLDNICAMHLAKKSRITRPRDRFFDTLVSWKAKAYSFTLGGIFFGYFISRPNRNGGMGISEINLNDTTYMTEALALIMKELDHSSLRVSAGPHETGKIAALAKFAENFTISPTYQFAILDIPRFTLPFMQLALETKKPMDGSFMFYIKPDKEEKNQSLCEMKLEINGGMASVESREIAAEPENYNAELCLSHNEAQYFLFSPLCREIFPAISGNKFLQSLLPLPLFYETPDGI